MSKVIRITVSVLAAAALGAGLWLACRWYDYPFVALGLPEAMKKAKAAGVPLTAAELYTPLVLSPAEDATSIVKTVWPEFDIVVGSKRDLTRWRNRLRMPDPDWSAAHEAFAAEKATMDVLLSLKDKSGYELHRDWDLGPQLGIPDYAGAKGTASALMALALVKSHMGDTTGAIEALQAARKVGTMIRREPLLFSVVLGAFIDEQVSEDAMQCMADAQDSATKLEAIQHGVLEPEPHYDIWRGYQGELYLALATARNAKAFEMDPTSGSSSTTPVGPRLLLRSGAPADWQERAYMTTVLRFQADAYSYHHQHPDDWVGMAKALRDWTSEQEGRQFGLSHRLDSVWTPDYPIINDDVERCLAIQRCALAINQVLVWRAAHNLFPQNLREAGVTAIDPYTGEPLHYRATAGHIRVWSTGPDRVDSGGKTRSEMRDHDRGYDLAVDFPRVARNLGSP